MSLDLDAVLAGARIVPVLTIPASVSPRAIAAPLADALAEAGITAVEVALRTPAAAETLVAMATRGGLAVGAGTVLTTEQVRWAAAAGAAFLVSPGLDPELVDISRELDIPHAPGVATASELMRAQRQGLSTVKLFPVEPLGGLAAVRALAAPFPAVRFMPTGGVTPEQLPGYLAHPAVLAVGGSWIAPVDLLERGEFSEIRRRAEHAVKLAAP